MNYTEYIAENIDKYINYTEYIAENIDNCIDYTEYLAANLSKNYNMLTRNQIINSRKNKIKHLIK